METGLYALLSYEVKFWKFSLVGKPTFPLFKLKLHIRACIFETLAQELTSDFARDALNSPKKSLHNYCFQFLNKNKESMIMNNKINSRV